MPLRDHFVPPFSDQRSWEGFHGGWPLMIVRTLSRILPGGCIASLRRIRETAIRVPVAEAGGDATVARPGSGAKPGGTAGALVWRRLRLPPQARESEGAGRDRGSARSVMMPGGLIRPRGASAGRDRDSPRVDVDLCGWSLAGIIEVGRVEVGRERMQAFPVRGLPDHQHPVHPRRPGLRRLAAGIEPEALPDAIMDDDAPGLHVEFREPRQHGAERPGVAPALGMPLPAAERRPLPPRDPGLVVTEFISSRLTTCVGLIS